jgi:ABC-type polysaccharide/polyol phosphate export permease
MEALTVAAGPPPELRFKRRLRPRTAATELWSTREVVVSLTEREFRARYKQAFLGLGWSVVTPVIYMLVFNVFFQRVAKVNTGHVPYVLFSYVALIPWTFFSNAVSQGSNSLISNIALLNKVYFPREVFPISSVAVAAIDSAIATSVLAVLFSIETFAPKSTSFWIPVLLCVQLVFTVGVCLIMSSLIVYIRDLRQIIPMALQLGLFATPVAYGLGEIPGSVRWVYCLLNPLAPVIDGYRRSVLLGKAPQWHYLGLGSISAVVALVAGYWLFKRLETGLADVT